MSLLLQQYDVSNFSWKINHKLLRRISLADAIAGYSRLTWFVPRG
jgi:hypothetical protein